MADSTISGLTAGAAVDGTEEIPANQSGTKKLTTAQIETYIIEGANNSGSNQTAVGVNSGDENTGINQTAVGVNSGQSNTGINQTAVGVNSGDENTGNYQTAVGTLSGYQNSGSNQTAVGVNSGQSNTGNDNSNFGVNSGRFIADGTTANTTSSQSVYIGSQTKSKQVTTTNEIVIGYNAIGEGDNSVVLGNTSITYTVLRGIINMVGTPTYADDTAAGTGGLGAGDVYKTSTGELRIKL